MNRYFVVAMRSENQQDGVDCKRSIVLHILKKKFFYSDKGRLTALYFMTIFSESFLLGKSTYLIRLFSLEFQRITLPFRCQMNIYRKFPLGL